MGGLLVFVLTTIMSGVFTVITTAIGALIAGYFQYGFPRWRRREDRLVDESQAGQYQRHVDTNTTVGVITVGLWGHPDVGVSFEHKGYDSIKKIKIRCGSVIDSIYVEYTKPQGGEISRHRVGGYGGMNHNEVDIRDGEYINKVIGSYGTYRGNKTINSLTFTTNMSREFGPYGETVEEDGVTQTTPFSVEGGRIVGFYGNAGAYISAIGFYVLP